MKNDIVEALGKKWNQLRKICKDSDGKAPECAEKEKVELQLYWIRYYREMEILNEV